MNMYSTVKLKEIQTDKIWHIVNHNISCYVDDKDQGCIFNTQIHTNCVLIANNDNDPEYKVVSLRYLFLNYEPENSGGVNNKKDCIFEEDNYTWEVNINDERRDTNTSNAGDCCSACGRA